MPLRIHPPISYPNGSTAAGKLASRSIFCLMMSRQGRTWHLTCSIWSWSTMGCTTSSWAWRTPVFETMNLRRMTGNLQKNCRTFCRYMCEIFDTAMQSWFQVLRFSRMQQNSSLRRTNANCHWSSPPWTKSTRILLPALPATNTPHPLLQPSLSGSIPWIGTTARQIFWKHIALQWGAHFNLYHIYSYQSVSPWPSIQTQVYVRGHLASNLDWHCQRTCLQEFWGTIQRRAA